MSGLSRGKAIVFWGATLSLPVLCGLLILAAWRMGAFERPGGKKLNRAAWESSFLERGLPVPPGGPRDGFWGSRMPPMSRDDAVGWHEGEIHLKGVVDVDANGLQSFDLPGARAHVLIIGGSVAWGTYASRVDETYFAHAARLLQAAGWPMRFTVLAAGAWTSANELEALRVYGLPLRPDLVVFLDGLNDLTQGKDIPAERRVSGYVDRLHRARDLAETRGIRVLLVLQPTLAVKGRKSRLEKRILDLTDKAAIVPESYRWMRVELKGLEDEEGTRFLDCSTALSSEGATTFADIWHFSDPGQRLLGKCLGEGLLGILAGEKGAKKGP